VCYFAGQCNLPSVGGFDSLIRATILLKSRVPAVDCCRHFLPCVTCFALGVSLYCVPYGAIAGLLSLDRQGMGVYLLTGYGPSLSVATRLSTDHAGILKGSSQAGPVPLAVHRMCESTTIASGRSTCGWDVQADACWTHARSTAHTVHLIYAFALGAAYTWNCTNTAA
jgi:hypothetical protein